MKDFRGLDTVQMDETGLQVLELFQNGGNAVSNMVVATSGPFEKRQMKLYRFFPGLTVDRHPVDHLFMDQMSCHRCGDHAFLQKPGFLVGTEVFLLVLGDLPSWHCVRPFSDVPVKRPPLCSIIFLMKPKPQKR